MEMKLEMPVKVPLPVVLKHLQGPPGLKCTDVQPNNKSGMQIMFCLTMLCELGKMPTSSSTLPVYWAH